MHRSYQCGFLDKVREKALPLVIMLLTASEAVWISLLSFNVVNDVRAVLTFVVLLGTLFALFALSGLVARKIDNQRSVLIVVALGAASLGTRLSSKHLPRSAMLIQCWSRRRRPLPISSLLGSEEKKDEKKDDFPRALLRRRRLCVIGKQSCLGWPCWVWESDFSFCLFATGSPR